MDTIIEWIAERDPGAEVVPVILPGFTDSRHFREAFPECVAYGFFPQRHQSLLQTAPLVHAADERIDVRDLQFATEFFTDLARAQRSAEVGSGEPSTLTTRAIGAVPASALGLVAGAQKPGMRLPKGASD